MAYFNVRDSTPSTNSRAFAGVILTDRYAEREREREGDGVAAVTFVAVLRCFEYVLFVKQCCRNTCDLNVEFLFVYIYIYFKKENAKKHVARERIRCPSQDGQITGHVP